VYCPWISPTTVHGADIETTFGSRDKVSIAFKKKKKKMKAHQNIKK
jgi:hypothetical protein